MSGVASVSQVGSAASVDYAVALMNKARQEQQAQSDAVVALIKAATSFSTVGRTISVRA